MDLLQIPKSHIHGDLLLANKTWLANLLRTKTKTEVFKPYEGLASDELQAILRQQNSPDPNWTLITFQKLNREKKMVCPIPKVLKEETGSDVTPDYVDILAYVSKSNFSNTWKEAYKRWHSDEGVGSVQTSRPIFGIEHDVALLEVLTRLHPDTPVITIDGAGIARPTLHDPKSSSPFIASALAILIDNQHITVLQDLKKHSIHQALTFSPAWVGDSVQKLTFLVFQILNGFEYVHSRSLTVGDISLRDISISNELYVALKPKPLANLLELELSEVAQPCFEKGPMALFNYVRSELKSYVSKDDTDSNTEELFTMCVSSVVKRWAAGDISNFDYIMFLNHLCGRTFQNPNYYPVLPWVRDFSSQTGGWRDFSKSKFRLNKGDTQLDLTFESLKELRKADLQEGENLVVDPSQPRQSVQAPHHVTDVLSEITYYVYKARRTSQAVLCKYVRNRWVPAEYPSSMLRMMAWTPDECIPDFYTDPQIFKSVHEDLPDLELPEFCQTPESFIQWHRDSLESPHVSERLHQWIDLTFGYKLAGTSAIKAKNVCLYLVDEHHDLRTHGVVQLFTHPHPKRTAFTSNPYFSRSAPRLDAFLQSMSAQHEAILDQREASDSQRENMTRNRSSKSSLTEIEQSSKPAAPITLPSDYDPMSHLEETESRLQFLSELPRDEEHALTRETKRDAQLIKRLSQRCIVRDMQVLGCLIMEVFLPIKFSAFGPHSSLKSRYLKCRSILEQEPHLVPYCIRPTVELLLPPGFQINQDDRYAPVSELGLPPPSAFQLLQPMLSPMSFPKVFTTLAKLLHQIQDIDESNAFYTSVLESADLEAVKAKVGEFKVKMVASELEHQWTEMTEESLDLALPMIKKLFVEPESAIIAAWYLFEPVSRHLGPKGSSKHLLSPVIKMYSDGPHTLKHVKLYHRNFLHHLIVRFGTIKFLKHFCTYLVEAVGGYRDYDDDRDDRPLREALARSWLASTSSPDTQSRPQSRSSGDSEDLCLNKNVKRSTTEESFAEGEVFSFDSLSLNEMNPAEVAAPDPKDGVVYIPPIVIENYETLFQQAMDNLKCRGSSGNISHVASESVLWISHRIGPVLTARYFVRSLLRMLNLCYMPPESVIPMMDKKYPDQVIRVSQTRIYGDELAQNVLDCLCELACLYGEHVILLQYLPFMCDLLSTCKKKLTPNLEGGLLGTLALLHQIIQYLSDSMLMKELPDNLMANILFPLLQVLTTRSTTFHGGWRLRQALAYKFLDVSYLIGLRIGEEMSRSHLTPLSVTFFSTFDKVYDRDGKVLQIDNETVESKAISAELAKVMTPQLAYAAYVSFYNLLGRAHLESSIINVELVKTLCLMYQESGVSLPRPATFTCFRGMNEPIQNSSDTSPSTGGNALLSGSEAVGNDLLHSLISKDINSDSKRHLRGNWLAYWEYEIGRSERDAKFNLKQIKLQSFHGHTSIIKHVDVLGNENSFVSTSKDKTVKVWSLRNHGDGSQTMSCQWTYPLHKKSVFFASFLESVGHVVSCDSTIHVFDPFVGSGIHQIDTQRIGPAQVMTNFPTPSPVVITATGDSLLHLIDCRAGVVVNDLKVSMGSAGLTRTLRVMPDGHTVLVGHSSGYLTLLDMRTGRLRHSWKGHEGEILSLTPLVGDEFMSSSLDQTVSIWHANDGGRLKCHLSGAQEPVHCVSFLKESGDVISGTTANRIGIRHGTTAESASQFVKIRTDIVKGNLTAMHLLPMNRLLLLGQDNGNLILLS